MKHKLLITYLLTLSMWFNFCKWLKKDPTFERVQNGKIAMNEEEKKVIEGFLEQENLTAKELYVVTPGIYPKWNNRIHLEDGKVLAFYLDGVVVKDLTFLNEFSEIHTIHIRRANISTLPDLSSLSNLSDLSFQINQIKEVDLSYLPPLKKLNLGDNDIQQIKGLVGSPDLEKLDLSNNQIKKIEGLNKLSNLKQLNLGHNQVTKITGLEGLAALEHLSLIYNQIEDIENLAHLTSLRELHLAGNQIEDITYLEQMPFLRIVGLRTNKIKNITTPNVVANSYDFGIDSNPLGIFEKQPEDYSMEDSVTHMLYIAIFKRRASRKTGLRKGGVRNIRRSGNYKESMLGGAHGTINGSIKRLYGLYSMTILESRYFSEIVDVEVSITSGVLRVLLKETEAVVLPGQKIKLTGRLFELGYDERQLKLESLSPDVNGINYEVTIGKTRNQ